MKTNKLILTILAFCVSAAGFAQGLKHLKSLKNIRMGAAPIQIKTLRTPRLSAGPAHFQTRYSEALKTLETATRNAAAPVELTYTKQPVVIGAPTSPKIGTITRQKMALTQAQKQVDRVLYDWGESLARTNLSGYKTAPSVTGQPNGEAVLILNGNTAFIRTTPAKEGETVITPAEIGINADALNAAAAPLTREMLAAVWKESPEKIAQFVYLQQNFTESWEEFKAAADALHTLAPGKKPLEWLTGPSAQTQLVRQNYNYAAANLGASSAELLKFMSLQADEICTSALESYRSIMRLHNQNSHTPDVFQTFWERPVSI